MTADLLRRKLTIRAHGRSLVLVKRPEERLEHVVQKALLWALYLPDFPQLRVEVPLPGGGRYKPDLLALDAGGEPVLWGECGVVAETKLRAIVRRHARAHLVLSKWGERLEPVAAMVERALSGARRDAPLELIAFPADADGMIADDGTVTIDRAALDLRRWDGGDAMRRPPGRRADRRR